MTTDEGLDIRGLRSWHRMKPDQIVSMSCKAVLNHLRCKKSEDHGLTLEVLIHRQQSCSVLTQ